MPNTPSEYLTTRQAAALLGMSVSWLRASRIKGNGPPFLKIGSASRCAVRYHRPTLDAWLAERVCLSTAEGEAA